MSTRAISYLKKKKVPFEVLEYEHEQKGAEFAARATGFPLAQTVKTLVVELARNSYCLVLMPGDRRLDFKQLAQALNVKRTAMVDTVTAERLTGYRVGGISPFGIKQHLPVIMETDIQDHAEVLVNAGRRGMMLKMNPRDLMGALNCRLESIAR
jgi:Cys-tRNA(Pro)/Cys-tRNA(Cys) deacylase